MYEYERTFCHYCLILELPDSVPYSIVGEASLNMMNWPTAVTGSQDTTIFCAEVVIFPQTYLIS